MVKSTKRRRVLKVVETKTGKVVHEVDLHDKVGSAVECVMRGMLINMNTDRFHIDDTEASER